MTKDLAQPPKSGPFEPPNDAATLTDADRSYASIYLRLLDAEAAGVDWKTAAHQILNLDPIADYDHAKSVFDRFLARAQWMTRIGYEQLLDSKS